MGGLADFGGGVLFQNGLEEGEVAEPVAWPLLIQGQVPLAIAAVPGIDVVRQNTADVARAVEQATCNFLEANSVTQLKTDSALSVPASAPGVKEDPRMEAERRKRAVAAFQARLAGKTASQSRSNLLKQWWELSRPRREGTVAPAPWAPAQRDFWPLFQHWLDARGLSQYLSYLGHRRGWEVFSYSRAAIPCESSWTVAFHGTWWYALWSILSSGVLLESNDKELGHDFWEPGVYCSPLEETANHYGRSHVIFGDGTYHRVALELRVDAKQRKKQRKRGGEQWVFPNGAVHIHSLMIQINKPPQCGEERLRSWDPDLEVLPAKRDRPISTTPATAGLPMSNQTQWLPSANVADPMSNQTQWLPSANVADPGKLGAQVQNRYQGVPAKIHSNAATNLVSRPAVIPAFAKTAVIQAFAKSASQISPCVSGSIAFRGAAGTNGVSNIAGVNGLISPSGRNGAQAKEAMWDSLSMGGVHDAWTIANMNSGNIANGVIGKAASPIKAGLPTGGGAVDAWSLLGPTNVSCLQGVGDNSTVNGFEYALQFGDESSQGDPLNKKRRCEDNPVNFFPVGPVGHANTLPAMCGSLGTSIAGWPVSGSLSL